MLPLYGLFVVFFKTKPYIQPSNQQTKQGLPVRPYCSKFSSVFLHLPVECCNCRLEPSHPILSLVSNHSVVFYAKRLSRENHGLGKIIGVLSLGKCCIFYLVTPGSSCLGLNKVTWNLLMSAWEHGKFINGHPQGHLGWRQCWLSPRCSGEGHAGSTMCLVRSLVRPLEHEHGEELSEAELVFHAVVELRSVIQHCVGSWAVGRFSLCWFIRAPLTVCAGLLLI